MTATMYPYIPTVFNVFVQAHVISGSAMICIIIIKSSYKHGECIYL
jgi:hypothetical protein